MSATSITVLVPLTIRKSGRRKIVVAPDGCVITGTSRQARTPSDPALVKALARAFRYQRMLDDGRYRSISDMAAAEKLDRGYVGGCSNLPCWRPTSFRRSWTGGNRPG